MFKEKDIPLKIEVFANGEDRDFLIHSKPEIQQILQTICERNTRSAMYYNGGRNFVLTMLLEVGEEGIWIDPASRAIDNRHLLNSDEITLVSVHNQTKVQFSVANPWQVSYAQNEAIFLPFPASLLRLQRRDYYRLDAEPEHPLTCLLHPQESPLHTTQQVPVVDISLGGLSLEYPAADIELKPGAIYSDCEINLPEVGTLKVTLQIQNTFSIPSRSGKTRQRAGCRFIKQNREMSIPLQRYVAQMQGHAAMVAHQ
jgi:c-di-GMP-binding flagellar brake protein YcgR